MMGRVQWAGRASWVGTGFSWKTCTASGGKSAFPFAGTPLIIRVLGGLKKLEKKKKEILLIILLKNHKK